MANETIRQSINRADPNQTADFLRALQFGDILRSGVVQTIRRSTTAAHANVNAGSRVALYQQTTAPAALVISAYARAGTGAPGTLTLDTEPPAAGKYSIAPNGQITTAAADIWTDVDFTYIPEKGDVIEIDCSVVPGTGVCALPSAVTTPGVVTLLAANATAGGATGVKLIMVPGTGQAASKASLNVAKTAVQFGAADAVTTAHLTLLCCSTIDVNLMLEAVTM